MVGEDIAEGVINRYGLTGDGAEAVRHVLSVSGGSTSLGVFGAVFLLISVLSFARAAQRLFERWELRPLSIRNTVNDLR